MSDSANVASHSLKYARIERERRFLLARAPDAVERAPARLIEDLYVDGTRLRLRRVTSADGTREHKLGQKIALGSGRVILTNLYLSDAEFARLAVLPGAQLVKVRSHCTVDGVRFAIDVFHAPLDGLVLAEAEADSDAQLAAIAMPSFAHCEVTDRLELTGGSLATVTPEASLAFARRLLAGGGV